MGASLFGRECTRLLHCDVFRLLRRPRLHYLIPRFLVWSQQSSSLSSHFRSYYPASTDKVGVDVYLECESISNSHPMVTKPGTLDAPCGTVPNWRSRHWTGPHRNHGAGGLSEDRLEGMRNARTGCTRHSMCPRPFAFVRTFAARQKKSFSRSGGTCCRSRRVDINARLAGRWRRSVGRT